MSEEGVMDKIQAEMKRIADALDKLNDNMEYLGYELIITNQDTSENIKRAIESQAEANKTALQATYDALKQLYERGILLRTR